MFRAESDGIVVQEAVKYDVNNTCSDVSQLLCMNVCTEGPRTARILCYAKFA